MAAWHISSQTTTMKFIERSGSSRSLDPARDEQRSVPERRVQEGGDRRRDAQFVNGPRMTAAAPGRSSRYSAGNERSISSRVTSKAAVRESSRPKKSSTKRRATCVESARSVAG